MNSILSVFLVVLTTFSVSGTQDADIYQFFNEKQAVEDAASTASPAPLYFEDDTNAIYYPDGYQNWYTSHQLQKAGVLPTRRQFGLAGLPLGLIAAIGGVSSYCSYVQFRVEQY